jgi:hypothetical protein
MRIENRTPWKTEHLRAIASRVLDEVAPKYKREALIEFVPARGHRVTGYAYQHRVYPSAKDRRIAWYTKIRVPGPLYTVLDEDGHVTTYGSRQEIVARVIAHETGHWKGFSNRELHGSSVHDTRSSRARFAWAADMPLEPTEKKTVPIDLREARRVRDYQSKCREWETKIKRSQTALTKWRRRLALAESRLQKAARP